MKITVIQRRFLEKIWRELDTVEIQIIKDILNKKGKRSKELVNLDDPLELQRMGLLTEKLLTHLQRVRILSRIKLEGLELKIY